jgi:hypothetical protein
MQSYIYMILIFNVLLTFSELGQRVKYYSCSTMKLSDFIEEGIYYKTPAIWRCFRNRKMIILGAICLLHIKKSSSSNLNF